MLVVGGLTHPLHLPPARSIPSQTRTAWQLLSSASVAMATMWLPPSGKPVAKALLPKAITATSVCEEGGESFSRGVEGGQGG